MRGEAIFYEKQRLDFWWVHLLLALAQVPVAYGLYVQLVQGRPWGNNPMSDMALIGLFLFVLFIHVFVTRVMQLEIKVDAFGVYYRFIPFVNSFRFVDKNELKLMEVVRYNPLRDFGGWGYRISIFGKGRAFNIWGRDGLQLQWNNGKKLLLGTQRPDELKIAIEKLKRKREEH